VPYGELLQAENLMAPWVQMIKGGLWFTNRLQGLEKEDLGNPFGP